ncbi:hypothetical protein [Vulcaniibacterium tengchongense]|uniref:Uncharacterized protein n=1 Tax=Vulcaniibacterium tengchongense TaxID=1273429 RepID=A0A3N4VQX6_9GAMM|nr:hypothetical protein [Vulcaniibacterium tengchongense]RPE75444.1 hypothetical protein EDC50_2889 [Vulcaniibacterium tengchongense]
MIRKAIRSRGPAAALLLALAACRTPAPDVAVPTFDAEAAVAAIRGIGGADDAELDVRPLRDAQVEDLREQAAQLERERKYAEAAQALDQALQVVADDPAVLQERAEAALLQHRYADAERYARQALALGSRLGPLCRRHWETVAQARLAQGGDVEGARRERDACTVAAPPRY